MKAYKCDICGRLFEDQLVPLLPETHSSRQLRIAFEGTYWRDADICPNCLKVISDTVRMLSPISPEEEPKE